MDMKTLKGYLIFDTFHNMEKSGKKTYLEESRKQIGKNMINISYCFGSRKKEEKS